MLTTTKRGLGARLAGFSLPTSYSLDCLVPGLLPSLEGMFGHPFFERQQWVCVGRPHLAVQYWHRRLVDSLGAGVGVPTKNSGVHPGWKVNAEALPISKALSRRADGASVSRLSRASLSVTVIVETAAGVRLVLMPSIYASRNKELEVVVVVEVVEWVAG